MLLKMLLNEMSKETSVSKVANDFQLLSYLKLTKTQFYDKRYLTKINFEIVCFFFKLNFL